MNKKKYVLIFFVLTFLILTISLKHFFNTISHQQLSKEIHENISLLLEESNISFGEIKVSYGLKLKFEIPNIEIYSSTNRKNLISIKKIEIKSPIFAIFSPGFPVTYHLKGINIRAEKSFSSVMNMKRFQERMNYKKRFGLKTFHSRSKHNLILEDIKIYKNQNIFPFQYLRIRNFSWNRSIAYEIRHQIKRNKLLPGLFADYILIGEVNLGDSIKKKKLKTKSQIKIKQLEIAGIIEKKSPANGIIFLNLDENLKLDGHISIQDEMNLESTFFLKDGVLDLLDFALEMPVHNFKAVREILPVKNQGGHKIVIKGEIKGIGTGETIPKFHFQFNSPFLLETADFVFSTSLNGKVDRNKLDLNFNSHFSEGEIFGDIQVSFSSDRRKEELSFQLEEDLSLDLNFKKIDLKIMSLKKKSFNKIFRNAFRESEIDKKIKRVKINILDCHYETEVLTGGGVFVRKNKSFSTKKFELKYGKGGSLTTKLKWNKKYIKGDLLLEKFNFEGVSSLSNEGRFPLSGKYSGSIGGLYSNSNLFFHELKIDLEGVDGKMIKGESFEHIGSAMEKFSPGLKLPAKSNEFQKVHLKGQFINQKFLVKKIEYIDKNDELKILGSGEILVSNNKEDKYIGERSHFFMTLIDQKSNLWMKKSTLNLPQEVPLKINRVNRKWVPDLLYTINKIKGHKK